MISSESSNNSSPKVSARNPLAPAQETALYALLIAILLLAVGFFGNPWKSAWRPFDDACATAEDFLRSRGEQPESYELARVVRYYPDGLWAEKRDSISFAIRPAFTHQLCLCRPGWGTWILEVNKDAQLIRLFHEEPNGATSNQRKLEQAREIACSEAEAFLKTPLSELALEAESLRTRPHADEYSFSYRWPEVLGKTHRLHLIVKGEHLSELRLEDSLLAARTSWPWGRDGGFWQRWVGGLLLFFVAAVILIRRRGTLAWRAALFCGGAAFVLVFLERLLRVHYYEIAALSQASLETYVSRMVWGALLEALQAALVIGLVAVTGEALAREVMPKIATLTRLAPSQRGWPAAWLDAARVALPWALLVFIVEAVFSAFGKPSGFMRVAAEQMAYALSSPAPVITIWVQTLFHAIWHEGLFRFWLPVVILFFMRNSAVAVIVSAIAATLFGASGPLDWHHGLWFAWAILAGGIALHAGIRAAFLLHVAVLGGYTSLLLIWTGLAEPGWAGGIFIGLLLMGVFAIGVWEENARRMAS